MRHKKGFNHLGIKANHRYAMLANMCCSLIRHKRIYTTIAKAKALRPYIEPIITRSKEDTTHSRRITFSFLQDKAAVSELFRVVAPKIANRQGGYTRILKTGFRPGDGSTMCFIELVDFNETMAGIGKEQAVKTKKTRRSKSKKGTGDTQTPPESRSGNLQSASVQQPEP